MTRILEIDPDYQGAYNNLGMLYTEMGNYSAADKVFKTGLSKTPQDALLLNNYGYLLYKTKNYPKSLEYINKSIAHYSSNPYAYRNRGLVYLELKLMREACLDLKASEELGFKTYYGNEVELLRAKYCEE